MPNFFFNFEIIGIVVVVAAAAAVAVVVEVEYLTIGRELLAGLGFLRIHFLLVICQLRD